MSDTEGGAVEEGPVGLKECTERCVLCVLVGRGDGEGGALQLCVGDATNMVSARAFQPLVWAKYRRSINGMMGVMAEWSLGLAGENVGFNRVRR